MRIATVILFCFVCSMATAQNKDGLPYYEIPQQEKEYSGGGVAARIVDGLGFRYYWATEGLRSEDLAFRPNDEAWTSKEIIDHIYDLTFMLLKNVNKEPGEKKKAGDLEYAQVRELTLQNIKTAADLLRNTTSISELETSEGGFWYQLNGPIADALWHVGQVVAHRRTSGNPFNGDVNLYYGKPPKE